MEKTLQVLNELERAGMLTRYAIGGAMGVTLESLNPEVTRLLAAKEEPRRKVVSLPFPEKVPSCSSNLRNLWVSAV